MKLHSSAAYGLCKCSETVAIKVLVQNIMIYKIRTQDVDMKYGLLGNQELSETTL